MPKQSLEDLTIKWVYEEIYQYKGKPLSSGINNKYIKALLDVAGSDGVLTDAEKKWVLGYGAARGVPQEELDILKNYKLGSENSTIIFNNNSKLKTAEHFQAQLIYDGFRAAAADGALKTREIEAISAVAKYLGMKDEKFQELLSLYKEEEELRQKRIAFLFPKSYGEAIKAIDTHYGRCVSTVSTYQCYYCVSGVKPECGDPFKVSAMGDNDKRDAADGVCMSYMVMATTAMCPKGTIGCDTETKDGTSSITCCCNSNLCNGVSTLRQQSSIVYIIMGTFAMITYRWF